jgi:beta-phosphoglucomutase
MLEKFTAILLDFDGLLVDTEKMHYAAYQLSLQEMGYSFPWNFIEYCLISHSGAEALRKKIAELHPQFLKNDMLWNTLYALKTKTVMLLFEREVVPLKEGVKDFLELIFSKNIKCAVVTNSFKRLVDLIQEQHEILKKIPLWLTRESYTLAKPHPEGYLKALECLGEKAECSIGFEDTPRGIEALLAAKVHAVMVTDIEYSQTPFLEKQGVTKTKNFSSFLISVANMN